MSDEVYEQLAASLNTLPNGFPRTPSNVEIKLLKKIFSEEEASLAIQMRGKVDSIEVIAKRANLPVKDAEIMLTNMAKRGLIWLDEKDGKQQFRLAPFIVGIFEAQLESMDHELAHLIEDYLADGGAVGIMKPQPALHRVIPSQKAVKSEWILPYDDVKAILNSNKTFRVQECVCRVQQDHINSRRCNFPLKTCLTFSQDEQPPRSDDISREEALAILDKAEEIGLVHTVSNIMKGLSYVCNCCGCCCEILRGINDFGIEKSVAYANYYSVINSDNCVGCEICVSRCQVHAISMIEKVAVVDRKRCIGCGLCVTGCPNGAVKLQLKPDAEIVQPPEDLTSWEHQRLRNRGLSQ